MAFPHSNSGSGQPKGYRHTKKKKKAGKAKAYSIRKEGYTEGLSKPRNTNKPGSPSSTRKKKKK